ncbi:MAG: hypothetical protein HY873_06715 [Chloroflexi bacterium]|nr:hypothetical protein [Chloroflexota bacterium]
MPTATGADLAAVLHQRADELEDACADLGDAEAASRPNDGAWCVREQLSHLYGDDRDTFLAGIQRVLIEGVPELEVTPGITHYTADRREIAFPALVAAVCGQYRAIGEIAARLTDEEIGARVRIELLKDTPFGATPTMGEWLVAIADMHVPGHIAQIRETREALGA